MENATLVVMIGSRAVCQADCSGIGYKSAEAVVNINGDLADALHYNRTLALPGDISVVCERLARCLETRGSTHRDAKLQVSPISRVTP
jgi:3D-(3,5/4)-trihydroxycyclohexane-1,2-dione acylhydrolase (decyclizing)